MAGRYVTPTDRPQWPTAQLKRYAAIAWWSVILPFGLSFGAVYGLVGLYLMAGGRG